MTRASDLVRRLFLSSGRGTKWDLAKAMLISGGTSLLIALVIYGTSLQTVLIVLATLALGLTFFFVGYVWPARRGR